MAISVSSTLKSNFFCVAIYQVLSRRGIKKGVNTGGDSPWMKSASRPNIRKFRLIKTAVTTPRWGKIRLENKREKFFQLIILCHSVSQDIPGGSWSDFLSSSAHLHWWIVSMWVFRDYLGYPFHRHLHTHTHTYGGLFSYGYTRQFYPPVCTLHSTEFLLWSSTTGLARGSTHLVPDRRSKVLLLALLLFFPPKKPK
jgi:hypothetical protein